MNSANTTPLLPLSDAEQHAVRQLYRAFGEKNPDLIDQFLAPDWQDIPLGPGQVPGPAGLKAIIQEFVRAFPDVEIIVHELMGTAGRAAVRAEIRGTHQGEFFGIAPTNKQVRIPLHEFHHLENGRVTHTWHLEDWYGMFHQLGTLPPKL